MNFKIKLCHIFHSTKVQVFLAFHHASFLTNGINLIFITPTLIIGFPLFVRKVKSLIKLARKTVKF